jgi:hypothetical protein
MAFARDDRGNFDWTRPNDAYFERAGEMVRLAAEMGFVPALVLLWGDMVPGTWINLTYKTHPIPLDLVEPYVRRVVDAFASYDPIWIVSGDTDLPDAAMPWFETALRTLRKLTPDHLCMFHIGADQPLPDEWQDIYTIYSGHSVDSGDYAARQATDRWIKAIRRPIINSEPCYEGHVQGGQCVRVSAHDVRRAVWSGLLSGAKAGTACGGHGIWNWHRQGMTFAAAAHARTSLDWREALSLPGAWDMGFARATFEQHRLWELDPRQDLLAPGVPDSVRLSATSDASRFAACVPYAWDVQVHLDLTDYEVVAVNLAERQFEYPGVDAGTDSSTIAMTPSNQDVLLLGSRR